MFCENCGHKNKENMSFCTKCGAPLDVIEQPQPVAAAKGKKGKKIGVIIGVTAAVALLGFLLFSMFGKNLLGDKGLLSGGRSYETVVDKYISYLTTGDAEGVVSLMPEKLITNALKEEGITKREFTEFIGESLSDTFESLEDSFGEGVKISHEIEEVEDVTGYELDKLKDNYEAFDLKISAAKKVKVRIKVKGSWDEFSDVDTLPVIKLEGSWYLDMLTLGSS